MGKENWKNRNETDPDPWGNSLEAAAMLVKLKALAHKIQTAVRFIMDLNEEAALPEDRWETSPKHLRVGVNNAMLEHGALVALLIEKGVIKYKDYLEAQVEFTEREIEMYKKTIKERTGKDVNLI